MFLLLIASLGVLGLFSTMSPGWVPDLVVILVAEAAIVGAVRGARSGRVVPVAVGIALVIGVFSVLAVSAVVRDFPRVAGLEANAHALAGVAGSIVAALFIGALTAWAGRILARRFHTKNDDRRS
jgi:Na+/phosphate symporter